MKILTIIFTLFFNAFLLSYDLKGEYKCNHTGLTNIVFKNSYEAHIIIKDEKGNIEPYEFEYYISENIITFEKYFNAIFFFEVKDGKLYGLYDLKNKNVECIKQ